MIIGCPDDLNDLSIRWRWISLDLRSNCTRARLCLGSSLNSAPSLKCLLTLLLSWYLNTCLWNRLNLNWLCLMSRLHLTDLRHLWARLCLSRHLPLRCLLHLRGRLWLRAWSLRRAWLRREADIVHES